MGRKPGFMKSCLLGCLGVLVFGLLFAGISALLAWRSVGDQEISDETYAPMTRDVVAQTTPAAGRVVLELGQGEFRIAPSPPGEGLRVEAHYDRQAYALLDTLERNADGSWVYSIDFQRTVPGLQALFQALMGADHETYVHVYLPPEVPIALEIRVEEGGFESDIGGLWITEVDVVYRKGGFEFDVSEPLREPAESLSIRGSMGGFEASRLGNASPRRLDVHCRMGGADLGLEGRWVRDCEVNLSVNMGGMSVRVPQDVHVSGAEGHEAGLRTGAPEVPVPTLHFSLSEKMGEVELLQR